MIRILYVVALLGIVGAHDHGSWKNNMRRFFDTLDHDIKVVLHKSVPAKAPPAITPAPPSKQTTHGCVRTSSAGYQSTSSTTTADCEPNKGTPETSTPQYPAKVGSIRGIPGVNFPDYKDIPLTSFSCSDKDYIPGFYADLETGCQVFHVCWPHRRESFLCPVGTIFNQALLACDYWYSSNCSLASIYYNVNDKSVKVDSKKDMGSMVNVLLGAGQLEHKFDQSKDSVKASTLTSSEVLSFISRFLPVQAKVTVYPETVDAQSKVVATASVGKIKHRDVHHGKHTLGKSPSAKKFDSITSNVADVSQPRYSTLSPETSTPKDAELEQVIKRIMDDIDEKVDIIIGDISRRFSHKTPKPSRKDLPPTKLDPISIEPVKFPGKKSGISSASPTASDVSGPLYSTQSPETSTSKHAEFERVMKRLVNDLFEKVQNIIRSIGAEKPKPPSQKHLPPTELNPRFIVEPVKFPENKSATPGGVKFSSSTEHPSTATPQKPVKERIPRNPELSVSSMTKKALAANYLRLLDIRKA